MGIKISLSMAATAVVLLGSAAVASADEEGSFEVRLRGVYLDMANKSDAYSPLGIPENAIHVNDKWIPDLDVEYFFTPHWSSELVLTYPQVQEVTVEHSALGGPTAIGSFRHLPPTLTAKYNFLPDSDIRPYVGAGVNITLIYDDNLTVPTVGRLDLDHVSVGPAVQGGLDWKIAPHWFLNTDIKWAMLRSDIKFEGTKISEARLDPLLLGVGIGYRF